MEELQPEGFATAILSHVLTEPDLPVAIVLQFVKKRIERLLRGDVRLMGKLGHQSLQGSVILHRQGVRLIRHSPYDSQTAA